MTPDDTLALYILSRSLWWRHDLEQLDAEAVAAVIAALEAAQKDIASRLAAEAAGLATLSDWRREQDEALNAWADEVLAGARATITGTVSEASITAAAASLAAYNAILTLDGKASAVKSVGLTSAQIASWFQDTALGSGGLEHWVDSALDNGVKQSILAALRQVAVEGKGTAEAVRRVLVAASDAGFELTRREAITITRTFIQTANVNAQEAVYKANEGLFKGYKRVETLDNKTCLICALADGAEYTKEEKRPSLPSHPNCVVGETTVFAPDNIAAFVSTYCGPIFDITFSTGARVSVTANHMFLTRDGFTPAKSVNKGDYIFSSPNESIFRRLFSPNDHRNPSRIDQCVHALSESRGMTTLSVPATAKDLHGDGEFFDGNINIIAPDCLLRGDYETFFDEYIGKDFFTKTDVHAFSFDGSRYFPPMFLSLWLSLNCHVSGLSMLDVFFAGSSAHHEPVSVGITPSRDANTFEKSLDNQAGAVVPSGESIFRFPREIQRNKLILGNPAANFPRGETNFFESSDDSVRGNSEFLSHLRKTLVGKIPLTQVVDVKARDFFGHVYDLQTFSSLYIANGIVTSNCRGIYIPVAKSWRDFGIDVDDLEAVARPWTIRETGPIGTGGRKIENYGKTTENFSGWWASLSASDKAKTAIGPIRRRLLETGAVKWDNMWDKASGLPLTLEQMGYDRQGNRL